MGIHSSLMLRVLIAFQVQLSFETSLKQMFQFFLLNAEMFLQVFTTPFLL